MRQAEKGEKKNLVPNFVHTRLELENCEKNRKKNQKNQKTSFRQYFLLKRDEIGGKRVRKKKIFLPNSVHTWPGEENSEKHIKKIQKNKIPLSSIISIENGLKEAEKDREKFQYRIPFILHPGKKIAKKIAKNSKN